jgi:exonuclease VII large subunit
MKIANVKSKLFSIVGSLSIAGLVLASVVVAPTGTALAQTATPPARVGQQARDERLERLYQRERDWLNQQQQNLDKTSQIVSKVQIYIANQQAKGKDVSALQAALAAFQQQIATMQSSHTTAANVLGSHAGFDANGKVTDPNQARQTLLDGRQALRAAHLILRQAILDLHRALRAWRQANGLKVLPMATPSS